ncbi:MAG: ATP-dependent Clp protease adaptor ClpS [Bacteroidetes bacterium]|nr:ATP-dependent Clp protease adaptor ClpS [Bacteroidota bacterium]
MGKEKLSPDQQGEGLEELLHTLILFNDDIHSFDFVIDSLIEVCRHKPEQAEQCTLIAHLKGKCGIMTGSFEELKPKFDTLTNRGLSVEID